MIYNGKVVEGKDGTPLVRRKYSDVLLIFMLKGAAPEKYADRIKQQTQVSGALALEDVTKLEPVAAQARIADLVAGAQAMMGEAGDGST